MRGRILLKTNLMLCFVIVVGFLLTAVLSYRSNYSSSVKNIEHISDLVSEGIYYQMSDILSKPTNVSLTMANDRLLKTLLRQEQGLGQNDDSAYVKTISDYLRDYQLKYSYDSVFLVSAATNRYYNFDGVDRVLVQNNDEDVWYYELLNMPETDYAMNVDNDQVPGADNAITLFVNCKIKDDSGSLLGIVGVGLRIDQLQSMLRSYHEKFDAGVCFIDENGIIEISAEHTGYERVSLFDEDYGKTIHQSIIDQNKSEEPFSIWDLDRRGQKQDYVVTRYLSEIDWYLVVERDTQALISALNRQLAITVIIIFIIIALILFITTYVIRSFNQKIVTLTRAYEQERKTMFEKATEQMFEDIYEIDITRNRPANQATEEYFERLGVPPGLPYDKALQVIAEKQIKAEFRQGYLNAFSPDHVLEVFREGTESLTYDFMISNDGQNYYWMRITTRLLLSENDNSLHMLVYRQNINAEKMQEQKMQVLARTDEMTGLLNKTVTGRAIEQTLLSGKTNLYAFFIFDIDHFKEANDFLGHAFGDSVIKEFTGIIRSGFPPDSILGRIGGDEFVAFLQVPNKAWAEKKAGEMNSLLNRDYSVGTNKWHMSASIGVAFAPDDGKDFDELYQSADTALYETKRHGRNSFTLYHKTLKTKQDE